MNAALFRFRRISLSLLVTAVVDIRQLRGRIVPRTEDASTLLRLGHELLREARGPKHPTYS